jgi:tetratricopeptide (TPR) repeat protein
VRPLVVLLIAAQPLFADEPRSARELYDDGVKHYNIAEYDQAIDLFKRAYLISRGPSLLFNIGQAYRQKGSGHCYLALRFYKNYLREKPDASDRSTVETRMRDLERCVETEQPVSEANPAPPPPTQPPPAPSPAEVAPQPTSPPVITQAPAPKRHAHQIVFGVLGGLGGLALVSGAAALGLSAADYNQLMRDCPCSRDAFTTPEQLNQAGVALLALGGAALLAGAVTYGVLVRKWR